MTEEHLLVIKTRTSRINEIVNLVKQNRGYSVPEVIAMPVVKGNPGYLARSDGEVPDSLGRDRKNVDRGRTPEI